MINIQQIRSAIDATLDRLQAKAEAAEVQANLGRMELEQRFKAQYEELVRAASELQKKLENAGIDEETIRTRLKGALDELRVRVEIRRRLGIRAMHLWHEGIEDPNVVSILHKQVNDV